MARSFTAAQRESAEAARVETVAQLHRTMAESIDQMDDADAWRCWLELGRRLHRYSFGNTMLILAQNSEATAVAGYRTWQANDLDMRQSAIHRGGLGHGLAYATVTPGVDADGPLSVIRGVSAAKMVALYQDAAEDDSTPPR